MRGGRAREDAGEVPGGPKRFSPMDICMPSPWKAEPGKGTLQEAASVMSWMEQVVLPLAL